MQRLSLLLFLAVTQAIVDVMPDYYHTTQSLDEEIEFIATKCQTFMQTTTASTSPVIRQVDINRGTDKKMKAYILFGEHPRELISPESGIRFLNDLCDNQEQNKRILDNYEIRMILNANPLSRQQVEKGKFCLRENENGVDLNRNYDAHWQQVNDEFRQVSSGPQPFSEPETQAIRDSMSEFQPNVFLSVHSGTLGLYTPHAYSDQDGEFNEKPMMDVLGKLAENHCPLCDVGSAGKKVGYLSPGSCIDFAYDKLKVKYSFAFEIFHGEVDLQEEMQKSTEQTSFLQIQSQGKTMKQKNKQIQKQSCFLETKSKTKGIFMDESDCFSLFNPLSQEQYSFYVNNWSSAMSEMLETILDQEN